MKNFKDVLLRLAPLIVVVFFFLGFYSQWFFIGAGVFVAIMAINHEFYNQFDNLNFY